MALVFGLAYGHIFCLLVYIQEEGRVQDIWNFVELEYFVWRLGTLEDSRSNTLVIFSSTFIKHLACILSPHYSISSAFTPSILDTNSQPTRFITLSLVLPSHFEPQGLHSRPGLSLSPLWIYFGFGAARVCGSSLRSELPIGPSEPPPPDVSLAPDLMFVLSLLASVPRRCWQQLHHTGKSPSIPFICLSFLSIFMRLSLSQLASPSLVPFSCCTTTLQRPPPPSPCAIKV